MGFAIAAHTHQSICRLLINATFLTRHAKMIFPPTRLSKRGEQVWSFGDVLILRLGKSHAYLIAHIYLTPSRGQHISSNPAIGFARKTSHEHGHCSDLCQSIEA